MPKVDLSELIKESQKIEADAEKIDKNLMVSILRYYPKDTSPEFEKIGYEDLFDFI